MQEETDSAETYRRLEDDACSLRDGDAELYRDFQLERAHSWRQKERPNAAWARRYSRPKWTRRLGPDKPFRLAMNFLDESLREEERVKQLDRHKAEERQRAEVEIARREQELKFQRLQTQRAEVENARREQELKFQRLQTRKVGHRAGGDGRRGCVTPHGRPGTPGRRKRKGRGCVAAAPRSLYLSTSRARRSRQDTPARAGPGC